MSRYDNVNCPVCDKKFAEGDDVVVCPICGAPHHRECYKIEGKCHFEEEHASGKMWEDRQKKKEDPAESKDPKRCPKCSATNPSEGIFCQVCGYPMRDKKPETEQDTNPYGVPPIDITAFTTPYGGVDPEEEIDGVTAKELALFVGENSFYYVPRIKEIKNTGKKASWNWSAFIFSFAYFFNRKMYVAGAISLALFIISMVPLYVFLYHVVIRNPDAIAMLDPYMMNYSGLEPLIPIIYGAWYVYSGICLLFGLFANKWYTDFVYRKIEEVRETIGEVDRNSAEYSNAISKEGRTNRRLAMGIMLGVIFAVTYVVPQIINILATGF